MSNSGLDICPPFGVCKVCHAPATGHHYGAVTCEACKGFFKRAESTANVSKDGQQGSAWQNYHCYEGGNCVINIKERARCRKCRYEKCIKAGMSLDCVYPGKRWNRNLEHFITKPRTLHHSRKPEDQSSASLPDVRTSVQSVYVNVQRPPRCNRAEEQNAYPGCDYSAQMSIAQPHMLGYSVEPSRPTFPTASLPSDFPENSSFSALLTSTEIARSEPGFNFPSESLETPPVSNRVSVIVYGRRSV